MSKKESQTEYHVPGYNFNGPGTHIYDRLGLKYDGKVGTPNYFLPVDKLDVAALQHDLMYYNPNNMIRAWADGAYLDKLLQSETSAPLSKIAITAQQYKRLGSEVISIYSTINLGIESTSATWTTITKLLTTKIGGQSILTRLALPDGLVRYILGGRRQRPVTYSMNSRTVLAIATGVYKTTTGSGRQSFIKNIKDAISMSFKSTRSKDTFIKYKKDNDKVVDKYLTYLGTVGSFDKDGVFVTGGADIRVAGDEDFHVGSGKQSQEAYVDFFDEFKQYVATTNKQYAKTKGFVKYDEPVLDMKNIHAVESSNIIEKKDAVSSIETNKPVSSSPMPIIKKKETELEPMASPLSSPTRLSARGDNVGSTSPSASASASASPTRRLGFKAAYIGFTSNRPGSVKALLNSIGDSKTADAFKEYINDRYKVPIDSPIYIRDSSLKGIKHHLEVIAYLRNLDATGLTSADVKRGDVAHNTYLADHDPEGKTWLEVSDIKGLLVNSGKRFKMTIGIAKAKKALDAVNKRRALIGLLPIIVPVGSDKSVYKAKLAKVQIPRVANLYLTVPHLRRPPTDEELKKGIDSEIEVLTKSDSTFKGFIDHILGSGESIVIASKRSDLYAKSLLKEDGEDIYLRPSYEIKGTDSSEVSKAVKQIVIDAVHYYRVDRALRKIKDDEKFKQNTKLGRLNMLQKEIKNSPKDAETVDSALAQLAASGFIADIEKIVLGKPSSGTVLDVDNLVKSINSVGSAKLAAVAKTIGDFSAIVVPQAEEFHKAKLSETVEKPDDVRTLPRGVEEVDVVASLGERDSERLTKKTKMTEKANRLEEIKKEKAAASGGDLRTLIVEEEKIKRDIRDIRASIPKQAAKHPTVKGTSKKVGSLRPHFNNPTERAVNAAIGETPEQQMRDFKNWYFFDVPKDQTGQGTSISNPLVKQNERSTSFKGTGDIFHHFNQTYQLTDGVEERKLFYAQHAVLLKSAVEQGLLTRRRRSEEEQFLSSFDKANNGLFPQDQSNYERSDLMPIYQKPQDFFQGSHGSFQDGANRFTTYSAFEGNTNIFNTH